MEKSGSTIAAFHWQLCVTRSFRSKDRETQSPDLGPMLQRQITLLFMVQVLQNTRERERETDRQTETERQRKSQEGGR